MSGTWQALALRPLYDGRLAPLEHMFDHAVMGARRNGRGPAPRTDQQILQHTDDVQLLEAISRGAVTVQTGNRMDLRRLVREDLCLAGFGIGTTPTLLPRGIRIVAAVRGEVAPLLDE